MYRSDDPGGVELRFSILSIYARGLPQGDPGAKEPLKQHVRKYIVHGTARPGGDNINSGQ